VDAQVIIGARAQDDVTRDGDAPFLQAQLDLQLVTVWKRGFGWMWSRAQSQAADHREHEEEVGRLESPSAPVNDKQALHDFPHFNNDSS
jgi:hypothetical protein